MAPFDTGARILEIAAEVHTEATGSTFEWLYGCSGFRAYEGLGVQGFTGMRGVRGFGVQGHLSILLDGPRGSLDMCVFILRTASVCI